MSYTPIEDHGVIGDMHTVALVTTQGCVDWLCLPDFDSPSAFASLLDDQKGGHFSIVPLEEDVAYKQLYWPDTNVLVTRFLTARGGAEVTDFMPPASVASDAGTPRQLIRRVTSVRGTIRFRVECFPAFNYALERHTTELGPEGATFRAPSMDLRLAASMPLDRHERGASAEFVLEEGESAVFSLRPLAEREDGSARLSPAQAEALFRGTVAFWRRWLSSSDYAGRWREMVQRSALVLKLLTYEPTGAIVAAPTCSLPEQIGGSRNWDYRFTWVRDSAFTIYAFMRLGFVEEAGRFMDFLTQLCKKAHPDGSLQVVYGIDGRTDLEETTLDHLDGYRGSRPVRIGNGAFRQLQLDIYGALLDGAYLYNKYGAPIAYDTWTSLSAMTDWVVRNWQRPDDGIWEIRGHPQQFVHSKLMCWVALDRTIRLAEKRSFPADLERLRRVRDAVYQEIMEKGWSPEQRAFVQHYGSSTLDAANLLMPLTFFLSPTDPRMITTLEATRRPPDKGGLVANNLVYRYYDTAEHIDGLAGEEGTFNICTFWLVEALTRAGRFRPDLLEEARLTFERMMGFANHLGLFAEETGLQGGALGNFPQAFTHLALISAAFNLDRTLDGN